MGKALVFNGITISNPITKVTFKGVSGEVTNYVSKLSVKPTESQQLAFQTFIDYLSDMGLWGAVDFFYPMYGSVSDCKFGIKGNDLTIPSGATYLKGLNLSSANGEIGAGANKKGIIISNDWLPNGTITNVALFYNNPTDLQNVGGASPTYNNRGDVFVLGDSDVAENDTGVFFGVAGTGSGNYAYRSIGTAQISYSVDDVWKKGVKGCHFNYTDAKTRLFDNGIMVAEGSNSSLNSYKRLGINTWGQSTHNLTPSVNLLLGINNQAVSEAEMISISQQLNLLAINLGL